MRYSIALASIMASATMAADTIQFYFPAGTFSNIYHQLGHY